MIALSPAALKLLRAAQAIQKRQKDSYIAQDHIIAAFTEDPILKEALKEAGVTPKAFESAVQQAAGTQRVDSKDAEEQNEALSKYTVDLTEQARKGDVDPVIGRDQEIRRTIRVLSRRTKNNVSTPLSSTQLLTILACIDRRTRCRKDRHRRRPCTKNCTR
jgi:ATP-dependent Clp protease ATP-binding subunit ClpA